MTTTNLRGASESDSEVERPVAGRRVLDRGFSLIWYDNRSGSRPCGLRTPGPGPGHGWGADGGPGRRGGRRDTGGTRATSAASPAPAAVARRAGLRAIGSPAVAAFRDDGSVEVRFTAVCVSRRSSGSRGLTWRRSPGPVPRPPRRGGRVRRGRSECRGPTGSEQALTCEEFLLDCGEPVPPGASGAVRAPPVAPVAVPGERCRRHSPRCSGVPDAVTSPVRARPVVRWAGGGWWAHRDEGDQAVVPSTDGGRGRTGFVTAEVEKNPVITMPTQSPGLLNSVSSRRGGRRA